MVGWLGFAVVRVGALGLFITTATLLSLSTYGGSRGLASPFTSNPMTVAFATSVGDITAHTAAANFRRNSIMKVVPMGNNDIRATRTGLTCACNSSGRFGTALPCCFRSVKGIAFGTCCPRSGVAIARSGCILSVGASTLDREIMGVSSRED